MITGSTIIGIRFTTIVKENITLILSKFCIQKEIKLCPLSVLVTSSIHIYWRHWHQEFIHAFIIWEWSQQYRSSRPSCISGPLRPSSIPRQIQRAAQMATIMTKHVNHHYLLHYQSNQPTGILVSTTLQNPPSPTPDSESTPCRTYQLSQPSPKSPTHPPS